MGTPRRDPRSENPAYNSVLEINTLSSLALLWVFPAGMLPAVDGCAQVGSGVFLGIIGGPHLCLPSGKVASVYLMTLNSLKGGL